MFRKFLFTVAALAGLAVFATPARADLIVRVTSLKADGTTVIDTDSNTFVLSDPPPIVAIHTATFSAATLNQLSGDFEVITTSNLAVTANGTTSHSHNINVRYLGATGIGVSNQLIVEFLGTNYINPISPPLAFITSNASPSSVNLAVNSVTMVSGVSVTNAGLPGTAGSTAGLMGLTTGTGSMIQGESSELTPDPANGSGFNQTGSKFSFYQAFTFKDVTATGLGSLSAASTVSTVPAPAGLILALAGLPALVPVWLRRRKAAVAV